MFPGEQNLLPFLVEKNCTNNSQLSSKSYLSILHPRDGSPPGSPDPGILHARTVEWVAISFSNTWKWKVKVNSLSRVRLQATPWTAAYQAPPSMGFSRQESWSGVPLPSPFSPKGWREWCCTRLILQLYNLPPFRLYTPHPTEARHHWEITLLKKKKKSRICHSQYLEVQFFLCHWFMV